MTKIMLLVLVSLIAMMLLNFNQAVPIKTHEIFILNKTSASNIHSSPRPRPRPFTPPLLPHLPLPAPKPTSSPPLQPSSESQTLQIADKPCATINVNCAGGTNCNQPFVPGQLPCYPVQPFPKPPIIQITKISIRDIIEEKISIIKRFVCTIIKTLYAMCTGGSSDGKKATKLEDHIKNDIETHEDETSYNEIDTMSRAIIKRSPQQPYDINIKPVRIHSEIDTVDFNKPHIFYKPEQFCYVDLTVIENGVLVLKRIRCPSNVVRILDLQRYG